MTAAATAVTESRPASKREERLALLAAAAGYFCLLCGYYTLRPMREALALQIGPDYYRILFTTAFVFCAALLPVYWWLVGKTPRGRLPWLVYTPFVAVFVALALGLHLTPGDRNVAFAYFVALSVANLFLIAVFWSAMADVWRPELAKRFYGFVAAGGSTGAIVGPKLVEHGVHELGPAPLILVACVLIIVSAALTSVARNRLRRCESGVAVPDAAMPVGGRAVDDLRRLVTTPYLLGIGGILIAGQIIGGFMYAEQGKYVEANYLSLADRASLFARMEFWVNLLNVVFQAGVVTALSWRNSLVTSLSAMPLIVGASFVVMGLFPTGAVLLVTQVLRRSADYGLGKPTREMLFTVLNAESKFKSKSFIDIVLHRGSDAVAQWMYTPIALLGVGLAGMGWICAGLCVVMLLATTYLGRAFERQRATTAPSVETKS
jgi:ATP:ADP antiporter, AAA family